MLQLTRAQESRAAIERLYISMRHLFNRGFYKPSGVSGVEMNNALLTLRPEIYGSINDSQKVELDGLVYVMDRLPKGIEACRYITLTSQEGYGASRFETLVPAKRRRNCYRIDKEQMVIEVTNGRSEIYDILTHLTFMFLEADKIKQHAFHYKGKKTREWEKLESIVEGGERIVDNNKELAFMYLSTILGRTFEETVRAHERFQENKSHNSGLFHIVYWLGKIAIDEEQEQLDREISFTPTLRERIGHHIYGERWANTVKHHLLTHNLIDRPIHIISANMHSVMNSLYAHAAQEESTAEKLTIADLALDLSKTENARLRDRVEQYASEQGMITIPDGSGTNITVQLIDTTKLRIKHLPKELQVDAEYIKNEKPVILVKDYAFGEQAFEVMDELLKPYEYDGKEYPMQVKSITIMGKAGILTGGKGDIMIPTSHVFEGTADNYPLENSFTLGDFENQGVHVFEGTMITVLGTSLQNRDILSYFKESSWRAIGLEMEGAHYQKAIQAHMRIRKSISEDVKIRYAYYASDNPLITGSTLASGSLGPIGVKPTYLITIKCLNQILSGK